MVEPAKVEFQSFERSQHSCGNYLTADCTLFVPALMPPCGNYQKPTSVKRKVAETTDSDFYSKRSVPRDGLGRTRGVVLMNSDYVSALKKTSASRR